MAKLILSLDGAQLREFPLTKERTTIGRKPHNDVVIDNLAVSGEHAMIMTILNDSFLEDLGSTNGTVVNGQPIKKHFLQNNDVIELGKYKLKFFADVPVAQPVQPDFEKTMVLRSPMTPVKAEVPATPSLPDTRPPVKPLTDTGLRSEPGLPARAGLAPAVTAQAADAVQSGAMAVVSASPSAAAQAPASQSATVVESKPAATMPAATPAVPVGTIQILSGVNAGRELGLTKPLTTLGKPGVQVAVIAKRPQGYFITHVEGDVHPTVNGKALDAQAHPLRDHDVIELSGVKMEFFLKS